MYKIVDNEFVIDVLTQEEINEFMRLIEEQVDIKHPVFLQWCEALGETCDDKTFWYTYNYKFRGALKRACLYWYKWHYEILDQVYNKNNS